MNRMLIALDGSPRAAGVLAEAVAIAKNEGAKVRLFRAIPVQPEVPWDMVREFPPGGLEGLLSEQAKADLEAREREIPEELRDGVAVAIGKPWSTICAEARDYGADLIVVGSHGYGPIEHVLGTTSGKVVHHADRSVLVIRTQDT